MATLWNGSRLRDSLVELQDEKSGASCPAASELISKRIVEPGTGAGKPSQNAQARQGSRPGRRRGVEVDGHSGWSHDGIICTGEPTRMSKLFLSKGASLKDPARLFNSSPDETCAARSTPRRRSS
jgi:hypothetical protein